MNDSSVSNTTVQSALNARNAYLLFYERSNRLGDALSFSKQPSRGQPVGATVSPAHANGQMTNGGGNKRKDREGEQGSPFPSQKLKYSQGQAGNGLIGGRPGSPFKPQSSPTSPKNRPNGHPKGPPYPIPKKQSSSPGGPIGTNNFFYDKKKAASIHKLMQGRPRS